MNSHQRRKRRRLWERTWRKVNAILKEVYAPVMPSLIPQRALLGRNA